MTFFTFMNFTVPTVRTRRHRIARRRTLNFVTKAYWAFKARGVAGRILKPSYLAISTRCVATETGFTGWTFDFGCWSRLVEPFLHWNAFRSIGIGLVGIVVTVFARYGTKRIGIRSGCAFNAGNGSFVGGIGSRYASGFIGGFTFAEFTWITCSKCAIQVVRTRRHRIACRGTFGVVDKSTGAFVTRGVAGQILKEPDNTGLTIR